MLLHIETTIHNQIFCFKVSLSCFRVVESINSTEFHHSWSTADSIWARFVELPVFQKQRLNQPAGTWTSAPRYLAGTSPCKSRGQLSYHAQCMDFPSGQTGTVLQGVCPPSSSPEPCIPHCDILDVPPASQFLPPRGPQAAAAPQSLLCSASSK